MNTERDNSRCPQTDATKQVKDNGQFSWIGKTNSHSRKRTVDDSRPGRTETTKKGETHIFLEAVLDPSFPFNSQFSKENHVVPFSHVATSYRSDMTGWLKKEEKRNERLSETLP